MIRRGHADDRRVQVLATHGTVEAGVAEREHSPVANEPVALAIPGRRDPHDRLVEVLATRGAVERRVTERRTHHRQNPPASSPGRPESWPRRRPARSAVARPLSRRRTHSRT